MIECGVTFIFHGTFEYTMKGYQEVKSRSHIDNEKTTARASL